MGIVVSLTIFVCLMVISIRSCGSNKGPAQQIEEAIAYAYQVYQETIGQIKSVDGLNAQCEEEAKERRTYTARMRSYLLSNSALPADFRALLLEHVSAHNKCAQMLATHPLLPNNVGESIGLGVLNALRGKLDGGAGEIEQWGKKTHEAYRDISETWDAVLQCAIMYGAQIKQDE